MESKDHTRFLNETVAPIAWMVLIGLLIVETFYAASLILGLALTGKSDGISTSQNITWAVGIVCVLVAGLYSHKKFKNTNKIVKYGILLGFTALVVLICLLITCNM